MGAGRLSALAAVFRSWPEIALNQRRVEPPWPRGNFVPASVSTTVVRVILAHQEAFANNLARCFDFNIICALLTC
jgi:hypothetical protein